jgi:type IV pilus assembly protein PilE
MNRRLQSGVTLVELITVVAIVAILSTIAISSYRAYAQRAGRSEAKAALLQQQNNLERCFTRFNRYNDAQCVAATSLAAPGIQSAEGRYMVSAPVLNDTIYTLSAVPRAGGGMTDDTRCGTMTLGSDNTRAISGTSTVAECWR